MLNPFLNFASFASIFSRVITAFLVEPSQHVSHHPIRLSFDFGRMSLKRNYVSVFAIGRKNADLFVQITNHFSFIQIKINFSQNIHERARAFDYLKTSTSIIIIITSKYWNEAKEKKNTQRTQQQNNNQILNKYEKCLCCSAQPHTHNGTGATWLGSSTKQQKITLWRSRQQSTSIFSLLQFCAEMERRRQFPTSTHTRTRGRMRANAGRWEFV